VLRDVEASYGPFRSLFGVSFTVRERSVLALLGSNGSGKTTVVRICCGLLKPTAGSLIYDGIDITGIRAFRMARMGIVHAPEGRSVFGSLTVEENLVLTFRQVFGRNAGKAALAEAYELFPRLGERRRQIAGTLSGGEQRMLSLARVLAGTARRCSSSSSTFTRRSRSRTTWSCSRRAAWPCRDTPTSWATSPSASSRPSMGKSRRSRPERDGAAPKGGPVQRSECLISC